MKNFFLLNKFHFFNLTKFLQLKGKKVNTMGMMIEQPDTMEASGGKYVDKPGLYHAVISDVDENPTTRDGQALDGVQLNVTILAGTHADQVGRSIDVMMWNPRRDDEQKKQDGAKRVQTAWALATCLIGQFQAGAKAVIEPKDSIGRQIVLKLRNQQKQNDAGKWEDVEGKVQLSWADIFHVDDPWVEKNAVPLDASAIALIPAALRKIQPGGGQMNGTAVAAAAAVAATGNGNGAATAAAPATVDVGDV